MKKQILKSALFLSVLIIGLFSFLVVGQDVATKIASYAPPASLTFCSQDTSLRELKLDFSSDTLKIYGDLPYDEATEIFLKCVRVGVLFKLDTLDMLKEKIKELNDFINIEVGKEKIAKFTRDLLGLDEKIYDKQLEMNLLKEEYNKKLSLQNKRIKEAGADMAKLNQLALEIEPLQQRKELIEGIGDSVNRLRNRYEEVEKKQKEYMIFLKREKAKSLNNNILPGL